MLIDQAVSCDWESVHILMFAVSGLHCWSAWFGCMLSMLLNRRFHSHMYEVRNSYNDSANMCASERSSSVE